MPLVCSPTDTVMIAKKATILLSLEPRYHLHMNCIQNIVLLIGLRVLLDRLLQDINILQLIGLFHNVILSSHLLKICC